MLLCFAFCLILVAVLIVIKPHSLFDAKFKHDKAPQLFFALSDNSQEVKVGVVRNSAQAFDGLTLITSINSTSTYLIDNQSRIVNQWITDAPGLSAYLLDNGHLLRTGTSDNNHDLPFHSGGESGRIQEFTWDGSLIWDFEYASSDYLLHHGIAPLPNGNILMIAWERKTAEEAIKAGRVQKIHEESDVWSDKIIEVKPTGPTSGEIVWEWHVWDHLIQDYNSIQPNYGDVIDHPELINLNYINGNNETSSADLEHLRSLGYISGSSNFRSLSAEPDWTHINAISYNPQLDQIAISVREFNEIWIIDHSTSTWEAAGHSGGRRGKGGDLLYRWGNPMAYNSGKMRDQQLFAQHDVRWIEPGTKGEGNLLIFNNGRGRPGNYSSIDEIKLPLDPEGNYLKEIGKVFKPEKAYWVYTAPVPTDFYVSYLSGTQRLPNGNTLICDGMSGIIFEVTYDREDVVWSYIIPIGDQESLDSTTFGYRVGILTIHRYARDFSGFAGRELIPGDILKTTK